jgi:hypothetical protein
MLLGCAGPFFSFVEYNAYIEEELAVLTDTIVTTFEQATDLIREFGILPLANLIPEHPSLESLTPKEAWHNDHTPEADPWLWRDRFASEGVAAYGKFFKKKNILIAKELFPAVKAVLGEERTVDERYADGELSQAAMKIYEAIEQQGGIDTRALRKAVGMAQTEAKKDYDKALLELQESCDIVIAGVVARANDQGEKSGWNSMGYELADRWLVQKGVSAELPTVEEAKTQLRAHLERVASPKAYAYLKKLFGL